MYEDRSPVRTGAGRLLILLTWLAVLSGLFLWGRGISEGQGVATPAAGAAAKGRPAAEPLVPAREPMPAVAPKWLDIRSVGVHAPVVARGLDGNGAVDPPPFTTPDVVGWYKGGAAPGSAGAAVLVGHVDTSSQPAVFHALRRVTAGDQVRVSRSDGSVANFTVESVDVVPRKRFDPDRAYGVRKRGRAELRLITCGGAYDRERHTYEANVVVSAYLTGAVEAASPGAAR
ncbi:class F sortase [Streptomyces meridianus]|uniref:Class F sortase n=1 Tax=Streptomyces meridianus TaxID=2938945 RepID=A0ABT0WZY8_9ACTN|nr:class F sortase [Streptomyces meridianus]MCM2575874.1 class F sortase [Streptomyces meridianus]